MNATTIGRILQKYNIQYAKIHTPQKGYRNESYKIETIDGQTLNLILFKSEEGILERIKRANAASEYSSNSDLPVRTLYRKDILSLKANNFLQYAALYNYLPGSTIPWEAYTKNHIKLLGKTLSDLHYRLKDCPLELPSVANEYLALNNLMKSYFTNKGVIKASRNKLQINVPIAIFDYLQNVLTVCNKLPDQQPLHMDFVRGNILFGSSKLHEDYSIGDAHLSGVIDFEKTGKGHPLLDIARTLAFLLVDCKFKSEDKVRKYFLRSGYHKRGAQHLTLLNIQNKSLLEDLVNLFLLYDLYKFMSHNPYESLKDNEHYCRTRDLLTARAVLV